MVTKETSGKETKTKKKSHDVPATVYDDVTIFSLS